MVNEQPTRDAVLDDPCTHTIVRELLGRSSNYDIVDLIYDLELVVAVLKQEFEDGRM